RVHPEDELVERHPGDRGQVAPVERDAGVKGRREEVGERDDQRVGVALLPLDVKEALGAGAAGLVHDDERSWRELVLLGDAGDQARHLVGAATSTRTRARALWRPMAHSFRRARRSVVGETASRRLKRPDPVGARPSFYAPMDCAITRDITVGYLTSSAAFVASRRRKGTTAGISHFSHISSTFFWKYSRSSSVKRAKRPCFKRYSRTGMRSRPSTRGFVLP